MRQPKTAPSGHFRPTYVPRGTTLFPLTSTVRVETIDGARELRGSLEQGSRVSITFEVAVEHAPALRSAIDEISNEIGGRLEGPHSYAREAALTNAAITLGILRAAVNRAVSAGDPDYDHR